MNDPDPRQTSDGFDNDAIFADIVAHLDEEAEEPVGAAKPVGAVKPWVEDAATDSETAENEPDDAAATAQPPREERSPFEETSGLPTPGHQQDLPTPQVWRAHEVDDDYEEHFEPGPVAPLPVGDLQFWAIIAGMGGGPLLLLFLVLFNRDGNGYWILTAIAMSVGGFALLVSRLPGHQEDDDDGARL